MSLKYLFRNSAQATALLIMLAYLPASAETQTGLATVIDGDTLKISGITHRLQMIDAPEHNQTCERRNETWLCGAEATKTLRDLIRSRTVRCESSSKDVYGRMLSVCFVGDREINAEMVGKGMALAYRQYGDDYVKYEDHARENSLGLWEGSFYDPWTFRRESEQKPEDEDCPIKGNINAKGLKLYHKPSDPSYRNTVVTGAKGERWFCSVDEAEKAGWEPAWK